MNIRMSFVLFFIVSLAMVHGGYAVSYRAQPATENYESGRNKIIKIMSDDELGVAAYNRKNVHQAVTLDLTQDLNIAAIAQCFPCKTLIGKTFLEESFKCPVSPQDTETVIAKRQQAIKFLIEHPEVKKEVEKLLTDAQKNEQEVIQLLSDYFVGKTCPELKGLEVVKQNNPWLYPTVRFLNLNQTGKTIGLGMNLFTVGISPFASLLLGKMAYQSVQKGEPYVQPMLLSSYMALVTGLAAHALGKEYLHTREKRAKLHSLYELVTISERIEQLCRAHAVANQFNVSAIKNRDGIRLIQGLKAARYRAKESYIFHLPAVDIFLYSVYENQKYLAEVFACLAEMDAYNAIATRMLESRDFQDQFCFVHFIDSAKPLIHTTGFWNVLVPHAVANDIAEGHHIILTGPNAGGKTTVIRSLLQNIVFGQTFGVAAAKTFEFTPFDVIHSYLNVSDDLIHGDSLFVSEVKRAKAILQNIKTLKPGRKYFFALDELFTGTVAEDGETCAYEFVKKIASFSGVQFIYATHFTRLKELGANNPACINYKVGAPRKLADGTLVYPYTISQGANESRVAIDIAKQAKLFD